MEPAINSDLTASVTPPEDLTTSLFTDLGWYSDADGVPDGKDSCIGSDPRRTVIIGRCNSRAGNDLMVDGCSVSDRLNECTDMRPGRYLACIAQKTEAATQEESIAPLEEVGILLCAAHDKAAWRSCLEPASERVSARGCGRLTASASTPSRSAPLDGRHSIS